jgi:16S rRNA (guanine966-N2)-methyltransferase
MKPPSPASLGSKSSAFPPRTAPLRSSSPGEVRIIGGTLKRSKLTVLSKPGLRPTPDRVRETLFNWLGQDLSGLHCLDAFAGTGALGFEAASRGAASVLLVEQDAQLIAHLQAAQQRLKVANLRIQRGDAIAALRSQASGSIDLVFLDPPFDSFEGLDSSAPGLFQQALAAAASVLSIQGAIYLEAPQAFSDAALAPLGLQILKQGKAGAVHFHLMGKLLDKA